jgi:integrase
MNGEGGLYQRADGRWFGAVVLGYNDAGRPNRKTVSAKTKAGARQKLKDLQEKLEGGYTPPTREETLAQLFDRWDKDILSTQVQSDARDNYMTIAKCHILPTLGRKKTSALSVADVQHLMASKLKGGPAGDPRPLSVSTVRRIRSVLTQALDVCLVEGSLLRNVAGLTKPPKAEQREGRTLTPAEAKRFLIALEGDHFGMLFVTMLATGLRRGEALGLTWEDIDFKKATIGVHRQLRRIDEN